MGARRQAPTTSATSWRARSPKVVSFGAFVEIMDGVEGLVHISELAQHHVENPREIVDPARRGEGQDPRDRQRAPAAVAQPQARRGPGAAAARAHGGARGRRRGSSQPATRPRPPPEGEQGEVADVGLLRGGLCPRGRCGPDRPEAPAEPEAEPAAEAEVSAEPEAEPGQRKPSPDPPSPRQLPDAEPAPEPRESVKPSTAAEADDAGEAGADRRAPFRSSA